MVAIWHRRHGDVSNSSYSFPSTAAWISFRRETNFFIVHVHASAYLLAICFNITEALNYRKQVKLLSHGSIRENIRTAIQEFLYICQSCSVLSIKKYHSLIKLLFVDSDCFIYCVTNCIWKYVMFKCWSGFGPRFDFFGDSVIRFWDVLTPNLKTLLLPKNIVNFITLTYRA